VPAYTLPMLETRRATPEDAALITSHRRAMFADMGAGTPEVLDEMCRNFEPWVTARLADGRYLGWITEEDGKAVASAGLLLLEWPPHPRHPANDLRGYILNVFVEPAWRRGGLARALTELCVEEASRLGIEVVTLHASDKGRGLYEQLGFQSSNEMQLLLPEE
jgi:GNAT superfamily N-acetyltransferase